MRAGWILVPSLVVAAFFAAAIDSPALRAQGRAPARVALTGAISAKAAGFGITQRADQLPLETPSARSEVDRTPSQIRSIRNPRVRGSSPTGAGAEWTDLALQALFPEPAMPAAAVSFDGLSSQDNFNNFGFRVSPPDTNGAVGPSHFVQQTNLLVRVYTKAGVAVTAPFRLSSLFASAGVCATNDNGDPLVMYDALADRWILSQFGFVGSGTPPYHQCIAVSRTSNPAGAYYAYDFVTPGVEFPDYPHLGVWPDAYYMTVNQFNGGGPFDGSGAYAFARAKMLAGDPTASFLYFNLDLASHPEGIGGMLPSWADGLRPPPAGSPNVFTYFLATEFGDGLDGLRLFSFHADFVNPGLSTFTERPESPIAVAAFDPLVSRVPQPPPATSASNLDTLSDRLMHRLQYRNTGSAETLVVTHTVDADPTAADRAGIRYYELRRAGGPYSVFEQATYSPDTTQRWMGSAAEDNQGNLAVGFSAASTTVFPSIRFAGRLATDPPGGLFQGESTLVTGTGVQTSSGHRWGDYSALTVDPVDDCTFWFTTEYYTLASQASSSVGWLTRIGSFKFPSCTAPASGTINVTVSGCGVGGAVAGIPVKINGVLYGVTNASGQVAARLLPGTYTVSATGAATASQSVTVTAGSTQAVSLTCTAGQPDLVVDSLTAPSMSGAGLLLTIKDTTSNIGATDAPPTQTRFWLSSDVTPVAGAVILGNRSVASLSPGSSSPGSTSVTIPGGTPAGSYFIVAMADGPGTVTESDELNNTAAKSITIGPDLRLNSLLAPSEAARGTSFTVSDTTKNFGAGSTGVASVTRIYLSTNTKLDASDVVLGSRSVGVLAGKTSSSGGTAVTIPAGTAPGSYHLLIVADATGVVQEFKENNNKKALGILITP